MARAVLVRFELNRRGIAAIAVSPKVAAATHTVAVKGKAFAESIAPRDTGQYADGFDIEAVVVTDVGRPPMARAGSLLVNNVDHAWVLEVGTARDDGRGNIVTTPAFRVFGRTLDFLAAQGRRR